MACHYLFIAECALECFYSICWFTILFCKHRFQVYIVVFKQNTTALFSKYHPNSINFISRFLGGVVHFLCTVFMTLVDWNLGARTVSVTKEGLPV